MDVLGLYIREAFTKEGCPVCTLLRDFEERTLTTILYEHSNDPHLMEEFKRSLGLCPYHTWKLFEISSTNPLCDPLGIAVIYERMLGHYLKNGESVRESQCHVCKMMDEKEETVITSIAERIDEVLEYYENSPSVLCKGYYERIRAMVMEKDPERAKRLETVHKKKLEEVYGLLKGFIEKSSYTHTEGPSEEEVGAIRKSIIVLKGEPLAINQGRFAERSRRRRGFFGRKN